MKGVGIWRFEIEDHTYDLPEAWAGKGWEDLLPFAVRRWCVDNGVTQGRWVEVTHRIKLSSRRRVWRGKYVNVVRTSRQDITLVVAVHQLGGGNEQEGERDHGVRVEGEGGRQGARPAEHAGDGRRAGPAA